MPSKNPVISFRVSVGEKARADEVAAQLESNPSALARMAFLTLIGAPPEEIVKPVPKPVPKPAVVPISDVPLPRRLLGDRRIGPRFCTCIVGEPGGDGRCRKCRREVAVSDGGDQRRC